MMPSMTNAAYTTPAVAANGYMRESIPTYVEPAIAPISYGASLPTTFVEPVYAAPRPQAIEYAAPRTVTPVLEYAAPRTVAPAVEYMQPSFIEERVSYAAPSTFANGAGRDLKAGGRVVSERPISREELNQTGNLSESYAEPQGYSNFRSNFIENRAVVPSVAYSGRVDPFLQGVPLQSGSSFPTQVGFAPTQVVYEDDFRTTSSFPTQVGYTGYAPSYGMAPMQAVGGGVTMIG